MPSQDQRSHKKDDCSDKCSKNDCCKKLKRHVKLLQKKVQLQAELHAQLHAQVQTHLELITQLQALLGSSQSQTAVEVAPLTTFDFGNLDCSCDGDDCSC